MSETLALYDQTIMRFWDLRRSCSVDNNPIGIRALHTRFGTIGAEIDSHQSCDMIRLLIRGIKYQQYEDFSEDLFLYRVGRVELFGNQRNESLYDQGMVLFDIYNHPLLHSIGGLIGYGGAGPLHTELVLKEIGVPENIFAEIQQQYYGILSTERPYNIVIQLFKNDEGHGSWHWWPVMS